MKTKQILILSIILFSLSACNSGGSSSTNSQANQTDSISSEWTNVGAKAPNFIGGSNNVVYDKVSNSFFGIVRGSNEFSELCSISADAKSTDTWKCDTLFPNGYSVLHQPRQTIIGDNNGHLYVYGVNIPVNDENIDNRYILKYDIRNSSWESTIQVSYPAGTLKSWLPHRPFFSGNMILGVSSMNDNGLAAIDLNTGEINIESNFYDPNINGVQAISNGTDLYYANDNQLYTKSLTAKDTIASKVGSKQSADYSIRDIYINNKYLYTCGSDNIFYISVNSTENSASWIKLPPTSVYTYYNTNGYEIKETTSCDNIFANDHTIYAYGEVFESINQNSKISTRFQLMKYQRQ